MPPGSHTDSTDSVLASRSHDVIVHSQARSIASTRPSARASVTPVTVSERGQADGQAVQHLQLARRSRSPPHAASRYVRLP